MNVYKFNSKLKLGNKLDDFSEEEVKNEPMFFNSDPDFAYKNGGRITKNFLDNLGYDPVVVDSRVHMLMVGWYPCIPSWHHDDVPRSTSTGQPNYINPEYKSQHSMGLINGHICPTEFALGYFELPLPENDLVYKSWADPINEKIASGACMIVNAPTNQVIHFDCDTLHQGSRANSNGWRWFGRASHSTNRKPTNEIRRQVQVYLENPLEGW